MISKNILHYKILEKLGEGGMGIVWKAEDTKLNRLVAIKVLPPHLLISEDDRSRFHREAKAAAALNHSNIATVYEINESEEKPFIVMEYVEGQTLDKIVEAENLLPLQDAISIAIQIADGLGAAHKKGVVHRDIKASNILYSAEKKAKILDFGLAKTSMSTKLTQMGTTIGTVAYMSPEQVQGKEVDHRTDLWSLGVILYEMIAGQLPFKAEYDQAIFYSIQNENPDPLTAIRTGVPMALEWIVNKLMAKNPDERYQSAKDLIIDLKAVDLQASGMSRISTAKTAQITDTSVKNSKTGSPVFNVYTAIAIIIAALFGYLFKALFTTAPQSLPVVKASINFPKNLRYLDNLGGQSAISPDGKSLVYVAVDSISRASLNVLNMITNESTVICRTGKAPYPFWSPDSRTIGFFSDGKLKKVSATGGPVITLADAPLGRGGAWSKNGKIIYSPAVTNMNLYSVAVAGGAAELVTDFDSTASYWPRFPFFLPDGEHFLYSYLAQSDNNNSDIFLGSFDKSPPKKILNDAAYARYSSGYLFFLRQGILMAQPFNPETFEMDGEPVSIQGNINRWEPRAKGDFSLSDDGILIFASGLAAQKANLFLINQDGTETIVGDIYDSSDLPRLSPDGASIAYSEDNDIWIYNIKNKSRTRLTFASTINTPVWSEDGNLVFYNREVSGNKTYIFAKRADGVGKEKLIIHDEISLVYNPQDVAHNGRYLLVTKSTGFGAQGELFYVDLYNKQKTASVKDLNTAAVGARFSPDDEWIVFSSGNNKITNVFIQSFSRNIGKWQITEGGADSPLWLNDHIIYWSMSSERWERVKVDIISGIPKIGTPEALFLGGSRQTVIIFDGTRSGDKFLGKLTSNMLMGNSLSVIVNWKGLLEKEKQ